MLLKDNKKLGFCCRGISEMLETTVATLSETMQCFDLAESILLERNPQNVESEKTPAKRARGTQECVCYQPT